MEQEIIIGFESVSQAIMAEQALLKQAISVRVMPMPSCIQTGCGFCLRIFPEDFQCACKCLSAIGVDVKKAWTRDADGGFSCFT